MSKETSRPVGAHRLQPVDHPRDVAPIGPAGGLQMRKQPGRAGGAQDAQELVGRGEQPALIAADMGGKQLVTITHRFG